MISARNEMSDVSQKKSKTLPYSLMGIGLGGISGALYGYCSKSWLKSGDLSDKFVRESCIKILDDQIKQNYSAKDYCEKLKALLTLNIKKDISEEKLIKLLEKNADSLGIKPKNGETLSEAVRTFIKNNGGKDNFIEFVSNEQKKVAIDLKKYFNLKSKLKPLESNSEEIDRRIVDILKDTIKDFNKKAAIKWSAILAGILGIVGLGVGLLSNKNKKINV